MRLPREYVVQQIYHCGYKPCQKEKQNGAALVIAMLVVAMVSMIGTAIAFSFGMTLNRQLNQTGYAQARVFLLAGEQLAGQALKQDYEESEGNFIDDCVELSAYRAEFPLPDVGGYIQGEIDDISARFNINSLVIKPPEGQENTKTIYRKRFEKLLQALPGVELDYNRAEELTEAVVDWLDADDNPTGFGGRESGYYSGLERPYKPANRFMVDITELRAIYGFDVEIYRALLPYVTVYPFEGVSVINVNTAGKALLRALNEQGDEPFSDEQGQTILQARDDLDGFDSLQDFKNLSVFSSQPPAAADLAVASDWYRYNGKVMIADRVLTMQSVLFRDRDAEGEVFARNRQFSVNLQSASCQTASEEEQQEKQEQVVES